MNSSISNSKAWTKFTKRFLIVFLSVTAFLYGFTIFVDPFNILAISVPGTRHPIATNQRFSYPALASSDKYDSIILGTSTSRLFDTEKLNTLFKGRFANLAMNSATAWEQTEILKLFLRHNPHPKQVLIGVDISWCVENASRLTFRHFPEWMYDDDIFNDYLNHFNIFALEQAGRQFAEMTGLRKRKYGIDGYTPFVPQDSEHDLDKVMKELWQERAPLSLSQANELAQKVQQTSLQLNLPQIDQLQAVLNQFPSETSIKFFFVPYHVANFRLREKDTFARLEYCKSRFKEVAQSLPHAQALDFMFPNEYTVDAKNYWDVLHTTIGAATVLTDKLHKGFTTSETDPMYKRLIP